MAPRKPKDEVVAVMHKANDLELHVKKTTVLWPSKEDHVFVQIREYVPSTKRYGRGVVFSADLLDQVIDALGELRGGKE